MSKLNKITGWLISRSKKEQVYIFIFACLLLSFIWYSLFFAPLLKKNAQAHEQYQDTLVKTQEIEQKITLLGSQKTNLLQQITTLNKQNAQLERKIALYSLKKVDQTQIALLLRRALQEEQLTLVELKSDDNSSSSEQLDEKEITLVFLGNFYDAVTLLNKMKNSHYAWYIKSINYQVEKYPMAHITLNLSIQIT